MLIDRYLPAFDVSYLCEVSVETTVDEAYGAVRETDLKDPVVDALFAVRELAPRIVRRLRGEVSPPEPEHLTFGNLTQLGPGWVLLAEDPGREMVLGSVGRFWEASYGGKPVAAEGFIPFAEPGFAKLAVALSVRPTSQGVIIRYEARTATTDESARRTFRRYWKLISPGVGIVMRRTLKRMKKAVERRAKVAA